MLLKCKLTEEMGDVVGKLCVESRTLRIEGVPDSSSLHDALQSTFWEAVAEGFLMSVQLRKKTGRPALDNSYLIKTMEKFGADGAISLFMEHKVCKKSPRDLATLFQHLLAAGKLDRALELWRRLDDRETRNELFTFVKKEWKRWEHVFLIMLIEMDDRDASAKMAKKCQFSSETFFQIGRWVR